MPARMSGDYQRARRAAGAGPVTIARCGSQSMMSAPMRTSLSVKTRRFSNIHSWMRTEPVHCVARATAIEVRSAGNAGHGPSWTFDLYSPDVAGHDQLLAARDEHVVVVELGAQPEAVEHEADHPQVVGDRCPRSAARRR